jgi:hypothetical protein
LTYDEQTGVTREPKDEFKVGELLEFRSSDPDEFVKLEFHPKSAYEPNIYDESIPNQQPVRVVKAEKGEVWCHFRKKSSSGTPVTSHAWSKRYGFESDPGK